MNTVQNRIDLHVHTNYTDGTLSPVELIDRAQRNGVSTLSITDHDTLAPYDELGIVDIARGAGIDLISGIELSTRNYAGERFHILGYHIDTGSTELRDWLSNLSDARREYAYAVSKKLVAQGWSVDDSNFMTLASVTKAHIADTLLEDPANATRLTDQFGEVPSRGKFIETQLNKGMPFYVPREEEPRPKLAVEKIHAAGGVAVLAHPVACLYEQDITMNDIADAAVNADVDGLEAIYYYFSKSMDDRKVSRVKQFTALAAQLKLLVTGGSDFHGITQLVGRYTDVGMVGEEIVPEQKQLDALQSLAVQYQ